MSMQQQPTNKTTPPAYTKLGEEARKLFFQDFVPGKVIFRSRSELKDGEAGQRTAFKTCALHNLDKNKLAGTLAIKHHFPRYGIVLTNKWNTSNQLSTTLTIKDQLAENLKVALHSAFSPRPTAGTNEASIKCELGGDHYKVNLSMFPMGSPLLVASSVVSFNSWYAGLRGNMNIVTDELFGGLEVCMGRRTPFYNFHSFFEAGRIYGLSLYLKPHEKLELGARMSCQISDDNVLFGLVAKYHMNERMALLGKVDQVSNLILSVSHKISEDMKLTLSTQFSPYEMSDSSRIGAMLSFSPK